MTFTLPTTADVVNTVDLSHVIFTAVVLFGLQLLKARFPLIGAALAALVSKRLPAITPAAPDQPVTPSVTPAGPAPPPTPLLPGLADRPILNGLVNVLLAQLLAKHRTADIGEAVAREVAAHAVVPPAA